MKPKLITTLKDYSGRLFLSDAIAGVTVALVALPLSIAIAIASGATPRSGLVTAIIGGLLISLLGGSRVQIGGPTGAFIVVVAGVIAQYGFDGLLLATVLAGIILVIAALVKAGRFIALVPEAVIEGFTVGIALIIGVSQLKDLLGLSAHVPADLIHGLPALWSVRNDKRTITVNMLTEHELRLPGSGLSRVWPTEEASWFASLLEAIDDADLRRPRQRQRLGES